VTDPFRTLGLRPDPALTDDDVRAAWRRLAAATHPDRADGGDPAAFAAAAAAYSDLRTPFAQAARPGLRTSRLAWRWAARIRYGRPGRLALRISTAAAFSALVILVAGSRPATPALIVGALTWLIRTARHDLAARS
jgi:hypothetical protein